MATLQLLSSSPWQNFHKTVFRSLSDRYTIVGDPPGTGAAAHFDATARTLYPVIAQAAARGETLTAIGTK